MHLERWVGRETERRRLENAGMREPCACWATVQHGQAVAVPAGDLASDSLKAQEMSALRSTFGCSALGNGGRVSPESSCRNEYQW